MKINFKRDAFGKIQMFSERCKMYLSWIQLLLVAYTALAITNMSIWWFIIGAPLFIIWMAFDWYILLPQTLGVSFTKNPEWALLIERQERIECNLQKLIDRKEVS